MFSSPNKTKQSDLVAQRPIWLEFRSSKWFIGISAFVGAFTDGFLYAANVPVLPFSLVDRFGVAEEHVQVWLSVLLTISGISMVLSAPFAGWLADWSSSRQKPFFAGLALDFFAMIIFCIGRSPWLLVVARIFQGLSATVIYTMGLALITDTVPREEVGSWMGFVLSGMNLGALIAPFLAGIIYEKAGYYAVFAMAMGVIVFNGILRFSIIEKRTAATYDEGSSGFAGPADRKVSAISDIRGFGHETATAFTGSDSESTDHYGECDPLLSSPAESSSTLNSHTRRPRSWLSRTFPNMVVLLGSPRLIAALYGCFTHMMVITSFDAILPLFVKRTFKWTSSGAGLIFLAIGIPSTLGALYGALADRYGTRIVSLSGFAITIPSVALLGLVSSNSFGHEALLCVLLVIIGIGLNVMLGPLAADVFHEVEDLANWNPGIFGDKGGYAQAYSLLDAVFGLGLFVGPVWSGFFYQGTNWQITAGTLALLCAVSCVPVACYTGKPTRGKEEMDDPSDAA